MHPPDRNDRGAAAEQLRREAEALQHLCAYHPGRLTLAELDALMSEGDGQKLVDDTEVAVSELVRYGLVHRDGDFVFPTRAAMRAHQLTTVW